MTRSTEPLFQPFSLKSLQLKNRVVMAPMTRTFSIEGIPGVDVARYYARRAAADVGLIISEGTVVDRPASRNHPNIPLFHGEPPLTGWQRVIDAVHAEGGKMAPQLWHTGSVEARDTDWTPEGPIESPSGLMAQDAPRGAAMSEEDIADTVAAFAIAAADAKRLGFDTLEIHGAHGYLIDQFFWAATNRRTDRYGGVTLSERSRFAAEVVTAMRRAVGPDFPIILRVSQWKQQDFSARLATSPKELEAWLAPLVAAGVDIIHASQRRFWEPEFPEQDGEDGFNFAGWVKKVTGAATISVGSVGLAQDFLATFSGQATGPANIDELVRRLERGEFDLVAVGRALLGDPEWAAKIKHGALTDLKPFAPEQISALV